MAFLVTKTHHLVLDRRAIARPAALDRSGVHGRTVDPAANDLVRPRVGVGEMARDLVLSDPLGTKRKRRRRIVARLTLEFGVVDTAAVQARAGAGLKPPDTETELREMLAEAHRGKIARAACRVIAEPNMDQAFEKRSRSQDHAFGVKNLADLRLHATHASILDQQTLYTRLANRQVGRDLEHSLHPRAVGGLVGLGAARAHGRSLARVEEAELDSGFIDGERHLAAERVDLAYQVAFADPADRRIA